MWLFTPIGFFSVVRKPGDQYLTIRARVRSDLDALRVQHLPELDVTLEHQGTDYPYRARAPAQAWGRALAGLGESIDYANFKHEVQERQGKARAQAYSRVWSVLYDLEQVSPKAASKKAVPEDAPEGKRLAYGGVVVNAQGLVLLREPKDHYGGYVWTFPKGRPDSGESGEDAAVREVLEETGWRSEIVSTLPEWYPGDTTATRFYLMRPLEDTGSLDRETAQVRWVSFQDAEQLLALTRSTRGRERDLAVLRAAASQWKNGQS